MSFSTRTQQQDSEIIQDSVIDTNLDNEGDALSATAVSTNKTLGKLARMIYGLYSMIGVTGRRHSASFFTGANITLSGTITSSGVTVTGSSSLFLSELEIGDFISGTANEYREVQAIATDTSLTLVSAFSVNIGSAQVYKRRTKLAERLDGFIIAKGLIIGGLIFNSTALPPTIIAGTYEVNGKGINLSANATLALSDTFLQSRQILDSYCQYLVCVDKNGNKKYVLYGESLVSGATGSITSITGAGTTKTMTKNTGTIGAYTKKILVITGNDGVNGVFKITGGNGSTTLTFESQATITGTNVGTWSVYERIATLHITGSSVAITTDADIQIYTPSNGENGWDAGIVAWSDSLQGFYLTITGLTGYRILGTFRTDASANVLTDINSYRTGRNKNDNSFRLRTETGLASTATKVGYFTNYDILQGCDYLINNDSTNGCKFTAKRTIKTNITYTDNNKNVLLALNATDVTTTAATNTSTAIDRFMAPNSGMSYSLQCGRRLVPGDTLIEIGDAGLATRAGDVMFQGVIEPD